jgi:hypothetical protein
MNEIRPNFSLPKLSPVLSRPGELKFRVPRILQRAQARGQGGTGAAETLGPAAGKLPDELAGLLERLSNFPPQTAILGICDDQLPVLLDLADPASGALLVAADAREQRFGLLHTLIQTAAALNSPRSVQFLVLSSQPEEWRTWLAGMAPRHCLGVEGLQEPAAERWLVKLAGWADQRRMGSLTGPAVLLVVDDLSAAAQLEYDARVNFDWLVKEGPTVKIWPVAAASADALPGLTRWVRLFKSRVLGYTLDPAVYRQGVQLSEQEAALFGDKDQFAVKVQNDWLKFHVPA